MEIATIQKWVVCFNTFISVMAIKRPGQVQDLLGYASMITKASLDYEGTYIVAGTHFRCSAAAARLTTWSQVDASLWTMYFTSAKLSGDASGLAILTSPTKDQGGQNEAAAALGSRTTCQSTATSYTHPKQTCKRWNSQLCIMYRCQCRHVCWHCLSPRHRGRECPSTPNMRKPADSPRIPFPREGLHRGQQKWANQDC